MVQYAYTFTLAVLCSSLGIVATLLFLRPKPTPKVKTEADELLDIVIDRAKAIAVIEQSVGIKGKAWGMRCIW